MVGVWAVGLLGAGLFVTDPVSGYPPGTPDRLSGYSWHGALHDLFSGPAFVALAAACFVFGRRFVAWGERGGRPTQPLRVSSSWARSCSPAQASDKPKAS